MGGVRNITGNRVLFCSFCCLEPLLPGKRWGGAPHMKEVGMLVGNFELNP